MYMLLPLRTTYCHENFLYNCNIYILYVCYEIWRWEKVLIVWRLTEYGSRNWRSVQMVSAMILSSRNAESFIGNSFFKLGCTGRYLHLYNYAHNILRFKELRDFWDLRVHRICGNSLVFWGRRHSKGEAMSHLPDWPEVVWRLWQFGWSAKELWKEKREWRIKSVLEQIS